jgi:hypothetical protein
VGEEARMSRWSLLLLAAFVFAATPARAGDDDPIDPDADPDETTTTTPTPTDDGDLLDGDDTETHGGPGVDDDVAYRKQLEAVKGMSAEDELQSWDAYLEKYPRSTYIERIQKRMEALEAEMYEGGPTGPTGPEAKDAEVHLAQGLQLENMNPRTHFKGGFEWGLPDYINLAADYEYALKRNLSFHGGLLHRYPGWRAELGVKWAFVKSTKHQLVASVLGDVDFNTNPFYPALRPELAIGKKFGDRVDLQAQAGVELETREKAGVRMIGGANATIKASDSVAVFLESSLYMQSLAEASGPLLFRFDTASFGLKFMPTPGDVDPGQLEINLGTTVPYTVNFWQFHYGSIMGQVTYYL